MNGGGDGRLVRAASLFLGTRAAPGGANAVRGEGMKHLLLRCFL